MQDRYGYQRASDLKSFVEAHQAGLTSTYTPTPLDHIYIKLDFALEYENARTAEDAKRFLRSIARAAEAAQLLAQQCGGALFEVQGSTLHVALQRGNGLNDSSVNDNALTFVAALHQAFKSLFPEGHTRVDGWRMTVDSGKTLVVSGRGVHDDDSWVSLGKAANRPAKELYRQLSKPEADRRLQRFHVGVRHPVTGAWSYSSLDTLPVRLEDARSTGEAIRKSEPQIDFRAGMRRVMADAAPIAPGGSPLAPSPDKPYVYFGWVLRADLDGFTRRVQDCLDDDDRLQELADEFAEIMEAAADFVRDHETVTMAQLPWAGDNFTVAAVYRSKDEYEKASATKLAELPVDFDKEMGLSMPRSTFNGWAHGVAGGDVHGNAGGNVYLGGIQIGQRRFLVGAGEGFGRSTQAFGDINPETGEVVVFMPDHDRLADDYKADFGPATNQRGQTSTLFRLSSTKELARTYARSRVDGFPTVVTVAAGVQRPVDNRPYFK
ncbi:MAG: hypothetical protein RIE32_04965 [Phycisphaerales bacterium]